MVLGRRLARLLFKATSTIAICYIIYYGIFNSFDVDYRKRPIVSSNIQPTIKDNSKSDSRNQIYPKTPKQEIVVPIIKSSSTETTTQSDALLAEESATVKPVQSIVPLQNNTVQAQSTAVNHNKSELKNATSQSVQSDSSTLRKIRGNELTIVGANGQMGNQMFLYATLFGLAKLNGRPGAVANITGRYMIHTLNISYPIVADLKDSEKIKHWTKQYLDLPTDANISKAANLVRLYTYAESYTFFHYVRKELRQEFTFKQPFLNYAQRTLTKAKGSRLGATFVGVHVRRGDFVSGHHHLERSHMREATMTFFEAALNYFRAKFNDALFIVVSDDPSWCAFHFKWKDTFVNIIYNEEPAYDLALLSECNHSIFDYGSYGFWGAYLAEGETVYFANATLPGYKPWNAYNNFFLPEWHGIA